MMSGSIRGQTIEFTSALSSLLDRVAATNQNIIEPPVDEFELRQHPDIVALVSKAKRNEKNPPRKHHVVPASYLRRWTDERQLRVTEVDPGRSWTTTAEKAARITDYYNLASNDLDPEVVPPLLAETLLSEIEALGKDAIDAVVEKGIEALSPQDRSNLAAFLGFQYVRGDSTRQMIRKVANDGFKLQYGQLNKAGIRRELKRRGLAASVDRVEETAKFIKGLNDGTITVGPQRPAEVVQAFQVAEKVAELLYTRHWSVFATPAILLTCDEPVVPLGRPGENRGEKTGLANARAVIFPLAPNLLLVMFHHPPSPTALAPLTLHEIAEVNHEVMAHATRWAFERPKRKTSTALRVPPLPQATQIVEHDVLGKADTSIVRVFSPSRWAGSAHPAPWPVRRWI